MVETPCARTEDGRTRSQILGEDGARLDLLAHELQHRSPDGRDVDGREALVIRPRERAELAGDVSDALCARERRAQEIPQAFDSAQRRRRASRSRRT
jgi:hypothetical protein